MADFEGIQLIGKNPVGGCILMLGASSDVSGIVSLPEDIEVEIRRGVPAVIVRGVVASDYESVMLAAPELANRALDIFAMTGTARLALADVWSSHVAWWSAPEATVIRVWCSATLILTSEIKGVVRGPDGAVHSQDVDTTPSWHESMRYCRMSEITDDLFDAFRNVYLALESLLNELEPRKAGQGEGKWLKRALVRAGEIVDLGAYLPYPADEPVQNMYDELWTEVRNKVFHAKSMLTSFLPQDPTSRAKVADAKNRYICLYLDLAHKTFGIRFPTGGLRLSSDTTREVSDAMTKGWQVGFRADPAATDAPGDEPSPERAEITILPTNPSTDPRGTNFSAVIARISVPKVSSAAVVGRIFTFTSDGQRAFAQSLDGCLTFDGFDCCEFLVSVSVAGRQARKSLYAT